MDPSLASRDLAVMVQTPRTKNPSVPSGPESAAVTDEGLGLKRQRETVELLDCRHSRPCREWVHLLGDPAELRSTHEQDPAPLHLWTWSGGGRDRLSSVRTPPSVLQMIKLVHWESK